MNCIKTVIVQFFSIFGLLLFTLISRDLKAQDSLKLDKGVTMKIHKNNQDKYSIKTRAESFKQFSIRTDLLALLNSEYAITGEVRVLPKFSVEGTFGKAYDILGDIGKGIHVIDLSEKIKGGIAYRIGANFYPMVTKGAIEGFYIGFQYFYKDFEYWHSGVTAYGSVPPMTSTRSRSGVLGYAGYQIFAPNKLFVMNFRAGIGYTKAIRNTYLLDNNDQYSTEPLSASPITWSDNVPDMYLSVGIGLGK